MWGTGEGVWASKPSLRAQGPLGSGSASGSHGSSDTARRPGRPPWGSVAWGPAGAYRRGRLFRRHRRSRGPGGRAGPDGTRGGGWSPGPSWRAAPAVEQGVGEPQGRLGCPAPAEGEQRFSLWASGSDPGLGAPGREAPACAGTSQLQGPRPHGAPATATQRGGGRVRPGPHGSAVVRQAGGAQRPVGKDVVPRRARWSRPHGAARPGRAGHGGPPPRAHGARRTARRGPPSGPPVRTSARGPRAEGRSSSSSGGRSPAEHTGAVPAAHAATLQPRRPHLRQAGLRALR